MCGVSRGGWDLPFSPYSNLFYSISYTSKLSLILLFMILSYQSVASERCDE